MRRIGISLLIALAAITPATAYATQEWRFEAPKTTCYEDDPCWRVWMGNGQAGPEAPLYMHLPEGEAFDRLAPLFGYVQD